jgi:hypothetical protein
MRNRTRLKFKTVYLWKAQYLFKIGTDNIALACFFLAQKGDKK